MTKTLFVFLLSLFSLNAFAGYGGYIGKHDDRRYGSLAEPEYNGVVKLTSGGVVKGTGVFISENVILTNNHVVRACRNGCIIEFWNGSEYETANSKVLAYNEKANLSDGTDWGLLLSDKDSNFYKQIAPVSTTGQVQRGGYGILRVIEDEEIPFLRGLYTKIIKENKEECGKTSNAVECFNKLVDKKLKELGKKQLFKDGDNFKVQTCNIVGDSQRSNKMLKTDCDSSGGDSGAPLLRNNVIIGLNNGGMQSVFGESIANAEAIKTENFYMPAQIFINKNKYESAVNFDQKYITNENKEDVLGPVKPDSLR